MRVLIIITSANIGIQTTISMFQYILRAYWDDNEDSLVDGMLYKNYSLVNCSVQLLELSQFLWSPVSDQVQSKGTLVDI